MATISKKLILSGLTTLDHVISTSDLLMSVAPIRIMVTGGAVAVLLFNTRPSTEDVDFILDPNVDAAADYRAEFFVCAEMASKAVPGLPAQWLNDHVRVFIRNEKRHDLFLTAVWQDIVVFGGENLVAFASPHEWSLEGKLGRIQELATDDAKRDTDIDDCVELIRLINKAYGDDDGSGSSGGGGGHRVTGIVDPSKIVSAELLRELNCNGMKTPLVVDNAIAAVAEAYEVKYGKQGILF